MAARFEWLKVTFAKKFSLDLSVYTKEFRYNLKLAYPVILGMLGHTLMGIVDKLMVGQLGSASLAAVSLGNSFIFIAMSIGIGFSTALTPLVAEADSAGNKDEARSIFHHGLIICTALGIGLFIAVFLSKPLMAFMGQPQEVIVLAVPYLDWVALSLVPTIIYQGYKQFADGLSLTKYSMYAIVAANVINIPLNYALIYGLWFIPAYGVVGAALGTVISRFFMLFFMHWLMANKPMLKEYFAGFGWSVLTKKMVSKISSIGFPSAMQMLFEISLFTTAVWLSGVLGTINQAANEIALSLATITFMFAMGLSVTAMIRVSNQKGLLDYKKLIVVARSTFLLAIIIETIFAIIFVVFHNILPHLFLDLNDPAQMLENREVVALAAKLLLVAAVFQISDGIQVVVLGALRGLQDVKIPMYITFAAYWLIGFPIMYYLGIYTSLEAIGIWIGLLAGLTTAGLWLYIRFHRLTNRLAYGAKDLLIK